MSHNLPNFVAAEEPGDCRQFGQSLTLSKPILESAGPPMTSILVYDRGTCTRKVLFRQHEASAPLSQALQNIRDKPVSQASQTGVMPETPTTTNSSQLDEISGQTVFCIGSFMKKIIALAFLLWINKGKMPGVTLETLTRNAYNQTLRGPNEAQMGQFERDPSLRQSLVHYNAFAPANRFLLSPNGDFLATDDELIENIQEITQNWLRHRGETESGGNLKISYSNLNHAVVALIMAQKENRKIQEVLDDILFRPLGMNRTFSCIERLQECKNETHPNIAPGFRMSGNGQQFFPVPDHDYMSSTVAQVSVGAWSCTDDLAKLYGEVIKGYFHESDLISREIAEAFLAPPVEAGKDQPNLSPAGYLCKYPSQNLGFDTLNRMLGTRGPASTPKRGTLAQRISQSLHGGQSKLVHYKGGTVDGYTCTIYLCVEEELFVIALCNCTGPFDFSEPVARCIMEELLSGTAPAGIFADAQACLPDACSEWQQLEQEDAALAEWTDDLSPFLGTYKDSVTGRVLRIEDGKAAIQRHDKVLCCMKVGARGNRIRLFPESMGLFVDRVTFWRDLTFVLQQGGETDVLVGYNGAERYVKQSKKQ